MRLFRSEAGNALLLAVGAVFIISLLIIGVLSSATDNAGRGKTERSKILAQVNADTALNIMLDRMLNNGSNFQDEGNPQLHSLAETVYDIDGKFPASVDGTKPPGPSKRCLAQSERRSASGLTGDKQQMPPYPLGTGTGLGVFNDAVSCSPLDIGSSGKPVDIVPTDPNQGSYWGYVSGRQDLRSIFAYGVYTIDTTTRIVLRRLNVKIAPRVFQFATYSGHRTLIKGSTLGYLSQNGASGGANVGANDSYETSEKARINWKAGRDSICNSLGGAEDQDSIRYRNQPGRMANTVGDQLSNSGSFSCDPRSRFGAAPIPPNANGTLDYYPYPYRNSLSFGTLYLTEEGGTNRAANSFYANGTKNKLPYWGPGVGRNGSAAGRRDPAAISCGAASGTCVNLRGPIIQRTTPDLPSFPEDGFLLGQPDPSSSTDTPRKGSLVEEARKRLSCDGNPSPNQVRDEGSAANDKPGDSSDDNTGVFLCATETSPRGDSYFSEEEFRALVSKTKILKAYNQTVYVANRDSVDSKDTGISREDPCNIDLSGVQAVFLHGIVFEGCSVTIDKGSQIYFGDRYPANNKALTGSRPSATYPAMLVLRNTYNNGGDLSLSDTDAKRTWLGGDGLVYSSGTQHYTTGSCPSPTDNIPATLYLRGSVVAGKDLSIDGNGCWSVQWDPRVQLTRVEYRRDGALGTYAPRLQTLQDAG